MQLNINDVSFSRFGSYFVVSSYSDKGLFIRDIRGGDEDLGLIFKLELLDYMGISVPYNIEANETLLSIRSNEGDEQVDLCIPEPGYIRVKGNGGLRLSLNLKRYDHVNSYKEGYWELHSYSQQIKMMCICLSGSVIEHSPWDKVGNTEVHLNFLPDFEFILTSYNTVYKDKQYPNTFEKDLQRVTDDYFEWKLKLLSPIDERYDDSVELASYITWSAVVNPSGIMNKPAMYMSNNWMMNIWSWDHCFNAMALAKNNPELSYEQFIFFKDFQDDSGVLPDYVNDKFVSYACCKPPIHGWCYSHLINANDYFKDKKRLEEVYEMLEKWSNYWLTYRLRPECMLPYYNHGNDSGWDNASVFADGCPVISPDLPSYLILQFEALAEISELLGYEEQKNKWESLAEEYLDKLISELWNGERFVTYNFKTKKEVEGSKSLINLMPIVIGHRLPSDIRSKVVDQLSSSSFLTEYGLATEALDSNFYQENGYWRGPIWAPTTMLVVDGLRRCGEDRLAYEISRKFCDLTKIGGMAENFDPKSGKGLVDPAFTWTSSVFLVLGSHIYNR